MCRCSLPSNSKPITASGGQNSRSIPVNLASSSDTTVDCDEVEIGSTLASPSVSALTPISDSDPIHYYLRLDPHPNTINSARAEERACDSRRGPHWMTHLR